MNEQVRTRDAPQTYIILGRDCNLLFSLPAQNWDQPVKYQTCYTFFAVFKTTFI